MAAVAVVEGDENNTEDNNVAQSNSHLFPVGERNYHQGNWGMGHHRTAAGAPLQHPTQPHPLGFQYPVGYRADSASFQKQKAAELFNSSHLVHTPCE